MPEINQLTSFLEAAAHGSFSRAAEALHLSQSAVSQQIAALEREFGCRLFARGRSGVELTPPGEILAAHARRILAAVGEAGAEMEAIGAAGTARLRIGSSAGPLVHWLAELLPVFAARHPGLGLSVALGSTAEVCAKVLSGAVDVAVANLPAPPGLAVRPVYEETIELAMPPGHPLAAAAQVEVGALRGVPLVTLPRGHPAREVLAAACEQAGFAPEVVLETDNGELIRGFVARGLAVGFVPSLLTRHAREDLVRRPLAGVAATRRLGVVTREAEPRGGVVAEFIDAFAAHLASGRGSALGLVPARRG